MASKNTKARAAAQQQRPTSQVMTAALGTTTPPSTSPSPKASPEAINAETLKLELLASLRQDIADIFKTELRAALGDDLATIKSDLQSVKNQLASDKAASQAEFTTLKATVSEMGESLSTCTDEVVELKLRVERLTADYSKLEHKCEDLEARSRRNNVRIIGVPEKTDINTAAVANLLKVALQLDEEPLLDRAHRTLQPVPKPNERPRPVVVRFHYYKDCVMVLRRAREARQITVGDMRISIFPDHTAKVARARAAFNEVRGLLRGKGGVRYGLFYPARLRISYKGTEKDFDTAEDAKAYIRKMNIE